MQEDTCNSFFFSYFIEKLSESYAGKQVCLVMDNAAWHKSKVVLDVAARLKNIHFCFLPPYSPEYNPIERLWLSIKTKLKDRFWPSLEAICQQVELTLKSYTENELLNLCGYPYIKNIMKNLCVGSCL
jgi:transposase